MPSPDVTPSLITVRAITLGLSPLVVALTQTPGYVVSGYLAHSFGIWEFKVGRLYPIGH